MDQSRQSRRGRNPGLVSARAAALTLLLICASAEIRAADRASAGWCAPIEVAAGRGERGPWRQNESRYDYVDDPTVALDGDGRAHVAWVDQARKDVFFRTYSRDGSAAGRQPVNVSRSPGVFSWLPRIAVSPGRPGEIHVLWQEIVFSGGSHGGDIFFARSRDGGATFQRPLNISRSVGGDGKGRINRDVWHNGSFDFVAAADGTLYAAWTEYDGPLWFSRSIDRGASFSKPRRIAGDSRAPARAPALAVGEGGSVYLAWTLGEDAAADLRLARSDDRGRRFSEPRVIFATPGYSDSPKLALDAHGTLHLAFAESAGGPFDRYHVRYARSRNGGRTFEAAREISNPLPEGYTSAAFPALSVDRSESVHVLSELFAAPREMPRALALVTSADRGDTFAASTVVPGSFDAAGGYNGSQQGLLMRKLAVSERGEVAVANSHFEPNVGSRVSLMRRTCGRLQ